MTMALPSSTCVVQKKMRHLPLLKTSDSVGEKNRQCRANFWGFISALFCWFAAGWEEFKRCENSGEKTHVCVLLKAQEKDDPLMLTKAEILLKTIENWNQNVVCCCSKGTGVLSKSGLITLGVNHVWLARYSLFALILLLTQKLEKSAKGKQVGCGFFLLTTL